MTRWPRAQSTHTSEVPRQARTSARSISSSGAHHTYIFIYIYMYVHIYMVLTY